MIKFSSDAERIPGQMTFSNAAEKMTQQIHINASKNLANKLAEKMGNNACPNHPSFINEVLIDLSNEIKPIRIKTYCCNDFYQKLKLIEENKNPFA